MLLGEPESDTRPKPTQESSKRRISMEASAHAPRYFLPNCNYQGDEKHAEWFEDRFGDGDCAPRLASRQIFFSVTLSTD